MSKMFKSVHKSATKFAGKIDGHVTNFANGVSTLGASVATAGSRASDAPSLEALEGPSFAKGDREGDTSLDPARSLPVEPDERSSGGAPWWTAPDCDYICITIRCARHLAIMDFESKSCHSLVKLSVGSPKLGVYYEEQTRVVHRTRNPMWHQSFFFPIGRLNAETPFSMQVRHTSILVKREDFMGQVNATLGMLLEPLSQSMDPYTRWYRLQGKKATDKVSGDLQFSVTVLPTPVYLKALPFTRNLYTREYLQMRYKDRTLQITLHGVSDLKIRPGRFPTLDRDLTLDFKLYNSILTHKLRDAKTAMTTMSNMIFSFELDEQVLIDLSKCFEGKPLPKGKIPEGADLKISLKVGKETLARAQLPLWDVPEWVPEEAPVEEAASDPLGLSIKEAEEEKGGEESLNGSTPGTEESFSQSMLGLLGKKPEAPKRGVSDLDDSVLPPDINRSMQTSVLVRSTVITSATSRRRNAPESFDTLLPTLSAPIGELGRRYKRTMDSADEGIMGPAEIDMSLLIVAKKECNDAMRCAGDADDDDSDDDDEPLEPIKPPAPLENASVEMAILGKPRAVFSALTDADSAYLKNVMGTLEALRDINIPAWEAGANGVKTRKVTYVRPLNIPMAPKQCDVEEVHTVLVDEGGGFVLERKVSTNAPKGDAFYVLIQDVGVWDPSSRSTKFSSTFKIEIVKSLGMLKSVVEGGAKSSTKAGANLWAVELAKYMSTKVKSRGAGGAGVDASAAVSASRSAGGTIAGGGGGGGGVGFSIPIPSLSSIRTTLFLLSYLFLALGTFSFLSGLGLLFRALGRIALTMCTKDVKLSFMSHADIADAVARALAEEAASQQYNGGAGSDRAVADLAMEGALDTVENST